LKKEDIESAMIESFKKMFTAFIEFQREGSNWSLDKILGVNVNVVKYQPIKGSSFLPLPAKLARKKAIVNVQNTDDKCFMWSVLAALHPTTGHHGNPNRVNNYIAYQAELDFTGIPFPVKVTDIPKFEKKNGLSINVFGYERSEVYPLHLTKERGVHHVDLLILNRGEISHYCWIKNFNRLMGDQNGDNNQYHYCHYCLHGFTKRGGSWKNIYLTARSMVPSGPRCPLRTTSGSATKTSRKNLKCPLSYMQILNVFCKKYMDVNRIQNDLRLSNWRNMFPRVLRTKSWGCPMTLLKTT
jgi:hypothetical protein